MPEKPRLLVACEKSGRVRDAFLARGWEAWSCDLRPADHGGPHLQCDVREVLGRGWDLMIAHPPCTYLAVSGFHWTVRGHRPPALTHAAIEFVRELWAAPIRQVAIENPVSVLSRLWRKPDQVVHPWMFGDDASKATCFWLRNLPPLRATRIIPPGGWFLINSQPPTPAPECRITIIRRHGFAFGHHHGASLPPPRPRWANQRPDGQHPFLSPSSPRGEIRSVTWPGIAAAMAQQWGGFPVPPGNGQSRSNGS